MKFGLFLLVLYGIDFTVDPCFGRCAWTQEWGNTLAISERSEPQQHPQILDTARPFETSLPAHTHPVVLSPVATVGHYGAGLVYALLAIRC